MSFPALAGLFIAKLFSIAGIGGSIAGVYSKNPLIAIIWGFGLGIADSIALAGVAIIPPSDISCAMAIFVALLMSLITYFFWGRKRSKRS